MNHQLQAKSVAKCQNLGALFADSYGKWIRDRGTFVQKGDVR